MNGTQQPNQPNQPEPEPEPERSPPLVGGKSADTPQPPEPGGSLEADQPPGADQPPEVVEPAVTGEPDVRPRSDVPWHGPGEVRVVGRSPGADRRASNSTGSGDDTGGEQDEHVEGEGLLPLRLVPAGWRRNLLIGGTAAATVVVGLSELTSAWVVLVLPVLVAAMVAYVEVLDRVLYPDYPDYPDGFDQVRPDDDGYDGEPAGGGQGGPDSAGGSSGSGAGLGAGEAPGSASGPVS